MAVGRKSRVVLSNFLNFVEDKGRNILLAIGIAKANEKMIEACNCLLVDCPI